ncbi:MAG: hypothetical protein V4465_02595 [Patescibacteria group bacterium]
MRYIFFLILVPIFAHAFPGDLRGVVGLFMELINAVIPILMSLALLFFLWGIANFIRNAADTKAHADGRQMMIWAVVALFVMISYYAIIQAAQGDVFGVSFGQPRLPEK